jgi:hypothetical protein
LEGDSLATHQRELAWKELHKKCKIYGRGCIKRGREEEGEKILALATKCKP